MYAGLCRDAHVGSAFEHHHDVGATELEVGDLFALAQRGALFGGNHDGGYLRHTHGEDSHLADLGLQHDQTTHLHEFVAGFVKRLELTADDVGTSLGIALDRHRFHAEVNHTLKHTGLEHLASYRSVLTVIVGSVEELVHPDTAGEVILILRAFEELLDAPFQTLDVHSGVCVNLPLAIARSSRANTVRCVWGIIIFYFVITVCTDTVTYYLPFVFQDDKMPDSYTSIVTSAFFLSITLAGFILPYVLKWLKNRLTFVCMTCMLAGLLLLAIFHNLVFTTAASLLLGFGYGLLQPVFYTKASLLSDNSFSATRTISYIMTANYLGTAVTPLIFTGIKDLFHISGPTFPFWFGLGLLAVLFIVSLIKSRSFVFYTSLKEA